MSAFSCATLRTLAKIWDQPICPPTDDWIKNVVHIYKKILFSLKRKKGNSVTCDTDILSELNQAQKDKHYTLSCVESKSQTHKQRVKG